MDTWRFESSLADMNIVNKVNVDKSRDLLQKVSKAVAAGLVAVTVVEYLQNRRRK